MYYPNTNQLSALSGRTIKPDYQSYIDEQVAALPDYLSLKEQRDYNQKSLALQEDALKQSERQSLMNYALAEDQAEAAKKQQLYGNIISGGGLALNAYQALDEAGVDLGGMANKALNSVIPDPMSSVASVVDPQMRMTDMAGGGTLDQFAQGVNDWVVNPVSQGVDYLTDSAKKIGEAASDVWSDVSGWVEGLFS